MMKILMVCLGNICRSPMAQGILEKKIAERNLDWFVDSAGTSGYHDGECPDKRAISAAKNQKVDISKQISRKLTKEDLDVFDVILAMDTENYNDIRRLCLTEKQNQKVHLFLNFASPGKNMSVPDPYYDGKFDAVFRLLDEAMDSFVDSFVFVSVD